MRTPRLAMLDVDGTLLHGQEWHPGAEELLSLLAERRVPVALCSGRHVASLELVAANLPGVQWLGGSGGSVINRRTSDGWEAVAQRLLPTAVVDAVVDTVEEAGVQAWAYTTTGVVVGRWSPAVDHEVGLTGVHPVVGDLRGRSDVLKVLVLASEQEDIDLVRAAGSVDGCRVVQSFPGYLDVVPAASAETKGGDYLIEELAITWDEVFALGDGENDIGMLSKAGVAVCRSPLRLTALDPARPGQVRREAATLPDVVDFIRQAQ